MAQVSTTLSFGRTDGKALPAHESRDHTTTQETTDTDTDTDADVLACQRRARVEAREAKERARCRNHETSIVQREGNVGRDSPPDVRDHRGEVV